MNSYDKLLRFCKYLAVDSKQLSTNCSPDLTETTREGVSEPTPGSVDSSLVVIGQKGEMQSMLSEFGDSLDLPRLGDLEEAASDSLGILQ